MIRLTRKAEAGREISRPNEDVDVGNRCKLLEPVECSFAPAGRALNGQRG